MFGSLSRKLKGVLTFDELAERSERHIEVAISGHVLSSCRGIHELFSCVDVIFRVICRFIVIHRANTALIR